MKSHSYDGSVELIERFKIHTEKLVKCVFNASLCLEFGISSTA